VAIIAETIGYSPTTIERHATNSAAAYAQYIAAARASRPAEDAREIDACRGAGC
jgi:ubiquitin